jgi:NAD(P)-dependent dehydrogenase (short-subunit alcohol dehydrogenase family)
LIAIKIEGWLPDLIINSAGVTHPGYVQIYLSIFHELIEINYREPSILSRRLCKNDLRRSGHIVNICSTSGFIGVYGYTAWRIDMLCMVSRMYCDRIKTARHWRSIVFPLKPILLNLHTNKFKPFETKQLTRLPMFYHLRLSPGNSSIFNRRYASSRTGNKVITTWFDYSRWCLSHLDAMIASARRSSHQKSRSSFLKISTKDQS